MMCAHMTLYNPFFKVSMNFSWLSTLIKVFIITFFFLLENTPRKHSHEKKMI